MGKEKSCYKDDKIMKLDCEQIMHTFATNYGGKEDYLLNPADSLGVSSASIPSDNGDWTIKEMASER